MSGAGIVTCPDCHRDVAALHIQGKEFIHAHECRVATPGPKFHGGLSEALAERKQMIRDLGDMACIGCRANTCAACRLAAEITNQLYVAEAEFAERLAPIEALADVWSSPESLRQAAWIRERDVADRIRAALKAAR